MLTGRIFDAAEGSRIGLVVDVVPDDSLLEAAYRKADEIIANTAVGVGLTKEAMWTALEIPGMQAAIDLENRQQVMASYSTEVREKMETSMRARTRQSSAGH
jgi:enoyl-CoA hydratase